MAQVEKQYLSLDKLQDIREGSEPDILAEVAVKLDACKQKFNTKYEIAFYNDI